ncbi:MAG: GIY-YIG nuclease family protein [Candidatus Nealsonbacteria bacterium]|nr:GIY-YIG nuclease family protein [Candidatus Nealsonbacteria bacterium]
MYFVYVIKSKKDKKRYTGITNNLTRRINQHNHGSKATPSTKNRGPFDLIYCEKVENSDVARKREKYLKSGIGREFLKKFIQK